MKKRLTFLFLIIAAVLLGTAYSNEKAASKQNPNSNAIIKQIDQKQVKDRPFADLAGNKVYKIVLDPGHGGEDPGSIGASGRFEKDFTLSLAKKIRQVLKKEPQIEVYMTRDDDKFIAQEGHYRPKFANKLNADLYLSIHGNTYTDSTATGTESFYYHDNSQAFARILQKYVASATGFKDRGVKKESYFVLTDTDMPAALLEIGYLTNPEDEQEMFSDVFQQSIATSIGEGVKEYLRLK